MHIQLDSPDTTIIYIINSGSINETSRQKGSAHFLEHFLYRGSKNYPSHDKVQQALHQIGAEFNGFTGHEHTGFYIQVVNSKVAQAIQIMNDLIFNPCFLFEEFNSSVAMAFEQEKKVVLRELNTRADNTIFLIRNKVAEYAFPENALGTDIGGVSNIDNLTLEDLKDFYQMHYRLENMNYICCGPQSFEVFKKPTHFHLSNMPNMFSLQRIHKFKCSTGFCLSKAFKFNLGTSQKIFVVFKRLNQGILTMSNIAKLEILQHMITTHLFRTVRAQNGLSYGIDMDYIQYRNHTIINLITIFDMNRYHQGMKILLEEIDKPFSLEFFIESINFLKYNLILKNNNSLNLAQFYVDQASCFTTPKTTFQQMLDTITNMNYEEMNTFKREVFSKNTVSYIQT